MNAAEVKQHMLDSVGVGKRNIEAEWTRFHKPKEIVEIHGVQPPFIVNKGKSCAKGWESIVLSVRTGMPGAMRGAVRGRFPGAVQAAALEAFGHHT
jgi:hypothetical protein